MNISDRIRLVYDIASPALFSVCTKVAGGLLVACIEVPSYVSSFVLATTSEALESVGTAIFVVLDSWDGFKKSIDWGSPVLTEACFGSNVRQIVSSNIGAFSLISVQRT